MGCAPSKHVITAINQVEKDAAVLGNAEATAPVQSDASVISSQRSDRAEECPASSVNLNQIRSVQDSLPRSTSWKIKKGYSSGASSYSDTTRDPIDDEAALNRSRTSSALALTDLKQAFVEEGDLTQSVVRIETPGYGQPIEEIYDGVHDGAYLGEGVSGIVRLVTHKATGVKYAVKCLDIGMVNSVAGLRQLRDEIYIMCQLDHPNIVRIEEVYESANEIYIVQELCLGGDLFDHLDEQPDEHYTEAQCAKLVKQMLCAVRYLHSKGIIHRDLKLENFLFTSTKPDAQLKMIDFGLSKHFEMGQHHCEQVGTPYVAAPEIIKGDYDEKCDLWALGVITYLLLSGETPFGGLDGEDLISIRDAIMRAQLTFEPEDIWETISPDAKYFVKMLLNPNIEERPTAREAQLDRWIQVWAKKDSKEGNKLNAKTVSALMKFKEYSDMKRLLSEVLSFTLLPEQIVELRDEFEKIDTDGSGEISLMALKDVLLENAEAGALGALTEEEIDDLFESIRLRKSDPTIRWHEFLAAGLSRARVDDRNLRLAFDRLDSHRKGYLTLGDLTEVLGNSTENERLEQIWLESIEECKSRYDRITFSDFKKLMKGQQREAPTRPLNTPNFDSRPTVDDVPTTALPDALSTCLPALQEGEPALFEDLLRIDKPSHRRTRSRSFQEQKQSPSFFESVALEVRRPCSVGGEKTEDLMNDLRESFSLYNKQRNIRFAVLEASKQFDKKRNAFESKQFPSRASLSMKRGAGPLVKMDEAQLRAMFNAAAKKSGRGHTKTKTVSDVTGMIANDSLSDIGLNASKTQFLDQRL